jgi:hypothetical protein
VKRPKTRKSSKKDIKNKRIVFAARRGDVMEQDLLESSLRLSGWRNSEGRKFLVQLTLQIARGEREGELSSLHRCHFHGKVFLLVIMRNYCSTKRLFFSFLFPKNSAAIAKTHSISL